jgi:hypothetical protein
MREPVEAAHFERQTESPRPWSRCPRSTRRSCSSTTPC